MDERKSSGIGIHARRVLAYIVLIFISILCLFWFYVLFVNATRSHAQIQLGFSALPSGEFMNNWVHLMHSSQPVWNGLFNSVIVAAFSAILTTYFSCMTAYAIHVYNFKLKNVMFTFILMIMMIPTQVTALGFYRLMMDWNLMDSFIPLIIPAIAAPVVFFYMKQYMDSSLPLEIVEASRIDGAGEFKTFNMMILPIMKPAIAVQAIFAFVQSWNNYFIPSLLLTENKKKTLPILIAQLRSADFLKKDMGQVYMMIAFSIFPVIVVYLLLSKHIVQGVALGSVKG
ncbi:MAG TPA: carbohydrate ABC transporter permease [Lachnospiraceae bacterium]|jgi:multiple sugar transport system permease protein|nr:carbohydrate ABC transporter permease [Lachnospiraceae bacterium]CCZ52149.1 carbohydrate ABC transporter membrane protein 2 CUT1 family (TC 3.A.1.1.-) [Clostridium sp. CAG:75]HCK44542.1 carbohydrate ABC transporter permease [Lachnospiraceae bacterium]